MDKKLKLVIASGKGGVGKSMLTSALAMFFAKDGKKVIACDCDVDAPNLAIWLNEINKWDKSKKVSTLEKPIIDLKKCIGCGSCVNNCPFKALFLKSNKAKLNYFLCEGCGVCEIICPQKAIRLKPVKNGQINIKQTKYNFPLISGQLFPGESNSGKVVTEVKKEADKIKGDIMIIDSAPGTGCPVIASLQDANLAILITEPTLSALSDLKRVLKTVNYFKISYRLVINKWDINKDLSKKIEKWADKKFLGKISYDKKIFKAIANLTPILETNLKARKEIKNIYNNLKNK